jgi:hypothetical protein
MEMELIESEGGEGYVSYHSITESSMYTYLLLHHVIMAETIVLFLDR